MIVDLWNSLYYESFSLLCTVFILFGLRSLKQRQPFLDATKLLVLWFVVLSIYEGTQALFGFPFFFDLIFLGVYAMSKGFFSVRLYVTLCMVMIGPMLLELPSKLEAASKAAKDFQRKLK